MAAPPNGGASDGERSAASPASPASQPDPTDDAGLTSARGLSDAELALAEGASVRRASELAAEALGLDAEDMPEDPLFVDFDLSDEILEGLEAAGYERPTPVQVAAIPPMLAGCEVVVQARTGTGKTAAFGLPLLELLDPDLDAVQALVLAPTRELAHQVAAEMKLLGERTTIHVTAISGGHSMTAQIAALEDGAQVVCGTPGRVLDHLRRGTLDPRHAAWLVLDEADEMLSMGFARELHAILSFLPSRRRTCLFSATFPGPVERLIERHVKAPVRLSLSSDAVAAKTVEHHYYLVPLREKDRSLVAVLDVEEVESAIVFCNRRDETRLVANVLRRNGYHALPINSDLTQGERDQVMGAIKRGELNVLVATDIAARGIDISDLSHVINYAVPQSAEQYVHRTGRTGRIGRRGTAVSLVGAMELSSLKQVENLEGLAIEERRLPPQEELMAKRVDRLVTDIKHLATMLSPEERHSGKRRDLQLVAQRLRDEDGGEDAIYLLLQTFLEGLKPAQARAARDTSFGEFAAGKLAAARQAKADEDADEDENEDDEAAASSSSSSPRRRASASGRKTTKKRASRKKTSGRTSKKKTTRRRATDEE